MYGIAIGRVDEQFERGTHDLRQVQAENSADRLAAEDEAPLQIQLPDPVLGRVDDIPQALLALEDLSLGDAPPRALADLAKRAQEQF